MKSLRNENDKNKAIELKDLIETIKQLNKREKELKEHFKNKLEGVVKCGDIIICIDDKSRTSLDKKELQILLGDDLKNYEKVTNYKTITLKNAA